MPAITPCHACMPTNRLIGHRAHEINDAISQSKELSGRQWLRKEVGHVRRGVYIRHGKQAVLYKFAHVKVPAFNVLHPLVMFGVICKGLGTCIICRYGGGWFTWEP